MGSNVKEIRDYFENGGEKNGDVHGKNARRSSSPAPPDPSVHTGNRWWFSNSRSRKWMTQDKSSIPGPERRVSDSESAEVLPKRPGLLGTMYAYTVMVITAPFSIGFYFIFLTASLIQTCIKTAFLPFEFVWRWVNGWRKPEIEAGKAEEQLEIDEEDVSEQESDESAQMDEPPSPPPTPVGDEREARKEEEDMQKVEVIQEHQDMPSVDAEQKPQPQSIPIQKPAPVIAPINGIPPPPPPPPPASPPVTPVTEVGGLKEAIRTVTLKQVPKVDDKEKRSSVDENGSDIASALLRAVTERKALIESQMVSRKDSSPMRSDREWEE